MSKEDKVKMEPPNIVMLALTNPGKFRKVTGSAKVGAFSWAAVAAGTSVQSLLTPTALAETLPYCRVYNPAPGVRAPDSCFAAVIAMGHRPSLERFLRERDVYFVEDNYAGEPFAPRLYSTLLCGSRSFAWRCFQRRDTAEWLLRDLPMAYRKFAPIFARQMNDRVFDLTPKVWLESVSNGMSVSRRHKMRHNLNPAQQLARFGPLRPEGSREIVKVAAMLKGHPRALQLKCLGWDAPEPDAFKLIAGTALVRAVRRRLKKRERRNVEE